MGNNKQLGFVIDYLFSFLDTDKHTARRIQQLTGVYDTVDNYALAHTHTHTHTHTHMQTESKTDVHLYDDTNN